MYLVCANLGHEEDCNIRLCIGDLGQIVVSKVALRYFHARVGPHSQHQGSKNPKTNFASGPRFDSRVKFFCVSSMCKFGGAGRIPTSDCA